MQELRVLLVLLSGAVATVFACFGVCPAEACRIRMVADPELNAKGLLQVVQAGPRTGDISGDSMKPHGMWHVCETDIKTE